jgi:hypothetical protein
MLDANKKIKTHKIKEWSNKMKARQMPDGWNEKISQISSKPKSETHQKNIGVSTKRHWQDDNFRNKITETRKVTVKKKWKNFPNQYQKGELYEQ